MSAQALQISIFVIITVLIGFFTWLKCRDPQMAHSDNPNKEQFLAGGGLSWVFVAGSITLTNLSTDQLVGMNGNQMALLAWWELAAVTGLVILALVFLPVYYKYQCTTTTELLEKRYGDKNIRATIAILFLLGNVFIYLPIMLYTGSLFMQSMFGITAPILLISVCFAVVGAAYAILGGLRAVAVSDTYSGVGLLVMAVAVVLLSLQAINFDLSGIPQERLTMIGDNDSPIPWHTLLTGMIFIQIFYWSTNQTITQRAMASPTLKEAQKGVFAAAGIRLLIVPAIVVIPGIVSYKLYGDIGDAAYGRIVGDVLPAWLSGTFAAFMAAAVLTSFNSVLNSSTTLYVVDLHEGYINKTPNVPRLSAVITTLFVIAALALVPVYSGADSIINLVQQLNGLLSMPILSAFIVSLLFRNVVPLSAILGVMFGTTFYGVLSFGLLKLPALALGPVMVDVSSWHYIHQMLLTLILSISFGLLANIVLFRKVPEYTGLKAWLPEKTG